MLTPTRTWPSTRLASLERSSDTWLPKLRTRANSIAGQHVHQIHGRTGYTLHLERSSICFHESLWCVAASPQGHEQDTCRTHGQVRVVFLVFSFLLNTSCNSYSMCWFPSLAVGENILICIYIYIHKWICGIWVPNTSTWASSLWVEVPSASHRPSTLLPRRCFGHHRTCFRCWSP